MWHIELVKNKYESLEDLYSLLQYVFRLNKTADDSRRANIITDDLTGCLPAMIPDINNPDMVYRLMLFIIQRRHKDTPQLVRHRIVSFQASDCILPQDLIPLAQSIASSYVAKGFIAAYGIHADENNRPGDAFIHCRGKKVLFINNVFKGEKLSENSYMEEHYIYAILGSAWLSFEDEWENGMVAYCTFQQMSRCVYNIGNVRSCVFEKCREAIKECTSEISESRFEECEKAIVDVCAKAVVSNCQFIHCKGEKLLTTRGNSQVTIQDCEFSNIRWEEREFRSYTWQSMIVIGLAEKNFANADRPSRINRCIFNGICIVPNEPGKVQKKENSAYLIAVNIENYAKFKYPRAEVTDCTFVNCAAEHAVINKEPYDSVFGSSHNYTAIRAYTRNNTGLDQIGNPATFAESQNVKRKETDAASRKIGDSLPVE